MNYEAFGDWIKKKYPGEYETKFFGLMKWRSDDLGRHVARRRPDLAAEFEGKPIIESQGEALLTGEFPGFWGSFFQQQQLDTKTGLVQSRTKFLTELAALKTAENAARTAELEGQVLKELHALQTTEKSAVIMANIAAANKAAEMGVPFSQWGPVAIEMLKIQAQREQQLFELKLKSDERILDTRHIAEVKLIAADETFNQRRRLLDEILEHQMKIREIQNSDLPEETKAAQIDYRIKTIRLLEEQYDEGMGQAITPRIV